MTPEELARKVEIDRLEADVRCGYEAFVEACRAALREGGGVMVRWDGTIVRTSQALIVWGDPE